MSLTVLVQIKSFYENAQGLSFYLMLMYKTKSTPGAPIINTVKL